MTDSATLLVKMGRLNRGSGHPGREKNHPPKKVDVNRNVATNGGVSQSTDYTCL